MKTHLSNARRDDIGHEPTDLMLLSDPLDFIAEDHLRIRAVCETMDRIAQADHPTREGLFEATDFLQNELPLLLRDEDEDLFAHLSARCLPEDAIEPVLQRFRDDHATAYRGIHDLVEMLHAILDKRRGARPDERLQLTAFAALLRRQMIVENAIILPLARRRLTDEDLVRMRGRMIQRRGRDRLHGTPHAE